MNGARACCVMLLCCLGTSPAWADARQVAVAKFTGANAASVRAAILAALSDHEDIVVVSLDDLEFASRRFKVDLSSTQGRSKLSTALHVDLWIHGQQDTQSWANSASEPQPPVTPHAAPLEATATAPSPHTNRSPSAAASEARRLRHNPASEPINQP